MLYCAVSQKKMLEGVKSETFFNEAFHYENQANDVDMLDSELLNEFLFRSNDGGEDAERDEEDGNLKNRPKGGLNNDEDAVFDSFINTETLDITGMASNDFMGVQCNYTNDEANGMHSDVSDTLMMKQDTKSTSVTDIEQDIGKNVQLSSDYTKDCQNLVENSLVFGRSEATKTRYVNPLEYIDIDESTLPYKLSVTGLPTVSRVENQIKLDFEVTPPVRQCMVYLPTDCIARQKFYLEKEIDHYPQEFRDQLLYVEAFLLCASNNKTTYVCTRCVKREHRRASRRKSGLSDNMLWCNNENRRAVIFNNKQVFVVKDLDKNEQSKKFDLTARIVCYCRHHKAPEGFKILFVLKNSKGDVLAKNVTSSIMIMDKKPASTSVSSPITAQNTSNTDSGVDTAAENFSTSNSAEVTSSSRRLDSNRNGNGLTPSKYFDGGDLDPMQTDSNNPVLLTVPKEPMLSPTSMSEEGSESHASALERTNESHRMGSCVATTNISRMDNNQRKRLRHQSTQDGFPQRSWSNNSLSSSAAESRPQIMSQNSSQMLRSVADFSPVINPNQPSIQRVIPAQGPINGGIEITLLGSKFKDGLIVKFGENIALSTQCWSETTMVTYLPPASCAGQVFVTVLDSSDPNSSQVSANNKTIFTYVDDTDRQLIELALQIVGLKMNGKLEDARNIAKRIVGNDDGSSTMSSPNISPGNNSGSVQSSMQGHIMYSDEVLLVKVIKSLRVNSNLSMCDNLGRTLVHLASLKGYQSLLSILIKNGARVNDRDLYGFTPLHFACVGGDASVIRLLLQCKADLAIRAKNDITARQIFIANHGKRPEAQSYVKEVLGLFDDTNASDDSSLFSRKFSDSSFHFNTVENESLYSSEVARFTASASRNSDRSEYDESDFEENGDESLLTGDQSELDFDNEVTDNISVVNGNEGRSSMNSSLLNRMLNYLNEDLPKYEDLFPGSPHNEKQKMIEVDNESNEDGIHKTSSAPEDSQASSEDEEDALQLRFNRFFQQKQNFRNDKMLLFFWLPLTVILLSWYTLFKFGQEGDHVHYFTNMVSEYLRVVLAKILLGNERMKTAFKEQLTIFQNTGIMNDLIVAQ